MGKVILIFFPLFCIQLQAQNALFIPFGQTEAEVNGFLNSRDYIRAVDKQDHSQIVNVKTGRQQVIYHFQSEVLYAIEDERVFHNRKEAQKIVDACLKYLRQGDKPIYTPASEKGMQHFVKVEQHRVIELFVRIGTHKRDISRVKLRCTSRRHGPRMQTESFIAELE